MVSNVVGSSMDILFVIVIDVLVVDFELVYIIGMDSIVLMSLSIGVDFL